MGGGMAGLSAAIYLGRARRDTLVIDSGKSMARWEPDVQNYLGFPDGIAGQELIYRDRKQARRFGARFMKDQVLGGKRKNGCFTLDETVEYGLRTLFEESLATHSLRLHRQQQLRDQPKRVLIRKSKRAKPARRSQPPSRRDKHHR